jgi:hypothetical protein
MVPTMENRPSGVLNLQPGSLLTCMVNMDPVLKGRASLLYINGLALLLLYPIYSLPILYLHFSPLHIILSAADFSQPFSNSDTS